LLIYNLKEKNNEKEHKNYKPYSHRFNAGYGISHYGVCGKAGDVYQGNPHKHGSNGRCG
jgi:hypothetical protein